MGWYDFFIDFHDYKLCGDLPDIFGRDEELDLADMFHIHLAATDAVQAKWRAAKMQFRRTTDSGQPEEDFWLVYAYDLLRDEYLLLTIMGPDAHSREQWGAYLRNIHAIIVDPWIKGQVTYTDPDEGE